MLGDTSLGTHPQAPRQPLCQCHEHPPQILDQRQELPHLVGDVPPQIHVDCRQHELTSQRRCHRFRHRNAGFILGLSRGGTEVRREHHLRQIAQRTVPERLLGEDVEGGSRHFAGGDRLRQRVLVDDVASGGVHDAHSVLHLGERIGPDEPFGLPRLGHMQRDEVRLGKDVVQCGGELHAEAPRPVVAHVGVVGDESHPEGEGPLCHQGSDPPQPDHAQRLAVELHTLKARAIPAAGADGDVGTGHVARLGEQQRQRVLGRGDDVGLGGVDHQHPGGGGRLQVDVVHPDSGAPHDFELGRGGDHLSIHQGAGAHQERLGVTHPRQQLGTFHPHRHVHLAVGGERLHARLGDGFGNDDLGLHRRTPPCAAAHSLLPSPVVATRQAGRAATRPDPGGL